MGESILKMISFQLSGKFAHFRKFYTNATSLTYFIPPRTTISGILASILEIERDEYYEIFKPDKIMISVSIGKDVLIKKMMQTVNYLHYKYPPYLENIFFSTKKESKTPPFHGPTNFELLMPENIQSKIVYDIYVATKNKESIVILEKLEKKIKAADFGYGVYLGQRQFKGFIDKLNRYSVENIIALDTANYVNSAIFLKNASLDLTDSNVHIVTDQIPIQMEKEFIYKKKMKISNGRKLQSVDRIIYEKSGKRISGQFKNCYKIGEKIISFLKD